MREFAANGGDYLRIWLGHPFFEIMPEKPGVFDEAAAREMLDRRPDRPAVLAETGAVKRCHAGPSDLYEADKEGVILHDALFAPFRRSCVVRFADGADADVGRRARDLTSRKKTLDNEIGRE